MKTLLAILVTTAICYVIFKEGFSSLIARSDTPNEQVSEAAPTPKASPTPHAAAARADEDSDLYNSDGTLKRLPPGTKVEKFWGHIVQHLDDGRILMQTNRGRLTLTLPGKDGFIDGTYLPKFDGAIIGTHRYATTDGASRTVMDVLYIPPSALPPSEPAATQPGGAWLWDKDHASKLAPRRR